MAAGPSAEDPVVRISSIVQSLPAVQLARAVVEVFRNQVEKVRNGIFYHFGSKEGSPEIQEIRGQLHKLKEVSRYAKWMAILTPFARATSESLTEVYARTFERAAFGFAKMYLFCLFMRVLLSWFPGIDWNAQPWTFLRLITEPYLQIYRGILPPLFGSLDFTPLIGFLILQDVVEVMAPSFTIGLHIHDTSTKWTTSDVMCYLDGF